MLSQVIKKVLIFLDNSGEGVVDLDQITACPNQTFSQNSVSCHTRQLQRTLRPPRSLSSTPTVSKGFWTGRIGYNNTPVVSRRSPSRHSVLPRSLSALEKLSRGGEVYSRARMVDVIHSDDEMVGRGQGEEDHDVVLLPSGARQKVARGRLPGAETTVRYRVVTSHDGREGKQQVG